LAKNGFVSIADMSGLGWGVGEDV